jgi:putative thioredoxin
MAVDVSERDFATQVIERSREVPVVVDFWAAWCGPCRVLGPLLEQATADTDGKVELVKVDTDANPELSRRYGIRGIPAVKAFRDGEVVDEFVGALPQVQVERFVESLVPSEADPLVAAGDEASLRRALELEPGRPDAAARLARLLLARGDAQAALDVVEPIEGDFVAQGLAARARLALQGEDGTLSAALGALSRDDHEQALELLTNALDQSDDETRELVRKAMVGVFAELGADHDLSRAYRRRLATALY